MRNMRKLDFKTTHEHIKNLFGITSDDQKLIRAIGKNAKPAVPAFIDELYAWASSFPECRGFFEAATELTQIRFCQHKHWESFFNGEICPAYLENLYNLGRMYTEKKLSISAYVSFVNFSTQWWLKFFRNQHIKNSEEFLFELPLVKFLNLDLSIVNRAFDDTHREENIRLKRKAKTLEKSDRYKSDFLANMSHELRTPLNSIMVLSQILSEKESLTQKQKDSVNTIYQSGNDLLGLINGILDLSKVASGKMEVNYEIIPMPALAKSLKNTFKVFMLDKGLNFNIAIDADCPQHIISDRKRLEQVLRNFISNAFKFTGKGRINVRLGRPDPQVKFSELKLPRNKIVAFTVQDNGIGISKENQKIIFEAFQQEESGCNKAQGGTGLGLSVAKMMASLLGGEIQLQSEKDKGSIFTLYLPEKPKHEVLKKQEFHCKAESTFNETLMSKVSFDASFAGKTLLLVDDDMRDIFSLKQALDHAGFNVIVGRSGKEALAHLRTNQKVELVLMDILMPDMDGYEAIKHIRSFANYQRLPIIALTAKAMKGDRAKCLVAGASDYIAKPIDLAQLLLILHAYLK